MIDELIEGGRDLLKPHLCEECGYGVRKKYTVDLGGWEWWCPMCRETQVRLVNLKSTFRSLKRFVRFAA